MSQKTWGGRFSAPTDKLVEQFTESISVDSRLFPHDIRASQAHAVMLSEVGLLTTAEAGKIVAALDDIREDLENNRIPFRTALEDIHTHIESELIFRLDKQGLGDLGRKLHTARSRNDQVVTDLKLWTRDSIDMLDHLLAELQRSFLDFGLRHRDVIIPAYTHMQRAQPVLVPHYALAYVEKFQRDRDRLADARKRVNVLPLGAAALAGSSLPINRYSVAKQLGFDEVARNSLDVSSDRDFAAEFVFGLSLIAVHLSNWSEEWILWTTTEFDTIELPDEFCTGSSIMPHKKNPDVLELTRGKTGRVLGHLHHLLVMMKGLPMAYNRDMQEDKPAMFDAADTVTASVQIAAALVRKAKIKTASVAARLDQGFLDATTLMESFISRGVPMRTAHEAVGLLVRECEQKKLKLSDLPTSKFDEVCPGEGAAVRAVLGVANSIKAFQSYGSTAPHSVETQLKEWQAKLA
ncbi:argininosuccinate lyase [Zavarzinella formosa]|uniref:argininosuccinate lyase n=1 Tax=Zavarzinella formosa TaxID=360055 RepID=UPI0002F41762|nr:argininosuccinate lyase [Zavarzinella formosa]